MLKVHSSYRWVVAVCDKELVGKKFSDDFGQIDLSGDFFNGQEISDEDLREEVLKYLNEDATFNIVGEKSVLFFKKMGLVFDDGVLFVDGVPVSLILL